MTGGSDIRERVGAVFFAAVMVVSMVAIGGLAGTAAASYDSATVSLDSNDAAQVGVTYTTDITTSSSGESLNGFELDISTSTPTFNGDFSRVTESDITVKVDTTGDGSFDTTLNSASDFTVTANSGDTLAFTLASGETIAGDGDGTDAQVAIANVVNPSNTASDFDPKVSVDTTGDGSFDTTVADLTDEFSISSSAASITSVETRDAGTPADGSGGGELSGTDGSTATANNGQIDQLVVTFDQRIDDTTVDTSDFTVSGKTKDAVFTGSTDNDEVLVIDLEESGAPDTDAVTGQVDVDTAGATNTEDLSGQTVDTNLDPATSDGAAPAIVSASTADDDSDGTIDRVQVTMSEAIDDDAEGDITDSSNDEFSITGGTVDTVRTGAGSTDDETIELDVSGLSAGTDVQPDVTQESGNGVLEDDSPQENAQAAGDTPTVTSGDGAKPVITSFTGSPGTASATVTVSEAINANDGDLTTGEFTYDDVSGSDASSIFTVDTTGTVSSVDLTLGTQVSSNDLQSDTIALQASAKDPADNDAATKAVTLVQSGLPGSATAGATYAVGGQSDADVVAGSANESLGEIKLRDDPANSDAAFAGETKLTFPEGVTINTSASTLNTNTVITSQNDGVSVDSVDVTNNDRTITISHSGTSNNGEEIRIASGSVVLNIDGDAVDTSQNPLSLSPTLDTFSGEGDLTGALSVFSPTPSSNLGDDGGATGPDADQVAINSDGESLTSNSGSDPEVEITQGELVKTIDGTDTALVGNNTEIVLSLESGTGVTFNTDHTPTVPNTELDGDDSTDEIDTSGITVTESEVRIPVVDSIDPSTVDTDFVVNDLEVDTNGSATATDLNVSVTSPAVDSGEYTIKNSAGNSEATFSEFILINSPGIEYGADDRVPVGVDAFNIPSQLDIDGDNAQIDDGSTVRISTNSSAVSFVNDGDTAGGGGDGDGSVDAGTLTGGDSGNINSIQVQDGDLVLDVSGGAIDQTDGVVITDEEDIDLKIDSSAADDTDVEFTMTVDDTVSVSTDSVLTLERPDSTFNSAGGGNFTAQVDADGTQQTVGSDGGSSALLIENDEDDAISSVTAAKTYVNVSLERGTGVTFDKSFGVGTVDDGSDDANDIDIDSDDTDALNNVTVEDNTIAIGLDATGLDDNDDQIEIDQIPLNVSSDASNTTISVTTNTGDNTVTTELDRIITVDSVDPSSVFADANVDQSDTNGDAPNGETDYGTSSNDEAQIGEQAAETKPRVGSTVTSSVYVVDGGSDFGGANVDLEIVQTPDGSSGASLNATQITTASDGKANFEFTTGDTDGTYVVNASTDAGGVNITYVVQPGAVDGVTVTPVENAIAGDSSELGTASMFVNATDANGNPVQQSATVTVTADNVGASGVTAFDDLAADGTGTNNQDNLNDGEFSIDSNDGSSVIDVDSDQVEDVTITATISGNSDSGTVTFFDQVGQVDLALNQSTVEVDDTVAAEATISEGDGTTIEVPDVTVNYDDNNGANTTFAGGADSDSASTSDAGVASVNVTAEQLGSSTIDAQSNLRSANATLNIVENAGAQVQLANVNLDPSSVSANTTNDHNLTFDAVNVSGDGNTDSFTVTIPSAATLESANSVSVVDANGTDVSLSGGPDVSGNEITFDVAPDSSADTRTLSVTANVTVAAPDVENETTADITVDVSDSNNGQDSADVTLTVEPADVDPEDRFDTNGEPGIQSEEVLNAISAFNEDTRIGGEPVESGDVLDVISAFNEA